MSDKESYEEFLSKLEGAKIPEGRGKDAIWDAIDSKTEEVAETQSRFPIYRYLVAAASVALFVVAGVYFFASEKNVDVYASNGETKEIPLPDGSLVILNADSRVSYSSKWKREIQLHGEGFFKVKKGESFKVFGANGASVEVLGTSFNVVNREDQFSVSCKTGKVRVSVPDQKIEDILNPGMNISVVGDTVKRKSKDLSLIGTWQEGVFYFDNLHIKYVAKEIMRQFDVKINYESVSEARFNGYFFSGNLEEALEQVCLPLGITYTQDESGTIVFSKQ